MSYVALLRGINVGGKNKLAMSDLVALFAAEGCTNVSTFIQSGNVVFDAPKKLAAQVPTHVEQRIQERFGLQVPVVVRTAAELSAVVERNPFLSAGADADALHVLFLKDAPAARLTRALDPARSPPDAFALVGREVYLRCPNGIGRTKLTNGYFDKALATVSTGRNWRTVLKLIALAGR
jgi:uncharacterized protein (DUF1697 family)